jgi:hypothetical protein
MKHKTKTLEDLAAICDKVKYQGKGSFTALCLGHEERNPSMTVSEVDGKLLLYCFAGCPQEVLLDAAGMTGNRDYRPPVRHTRPKVDTSGTEERAERAVKLSTPAPDNHPYLVKKGIQPHGIGVLGGLYKDLPRVAQRTTLYDDIEVAQNVLVIPMQDISGKILSCQFIAEDGTKAYMAGTKQKGGFYRIKGNDRIWICEGFATGASLHQDTGDTVICAFDTNGLMPVTGAVTALYGSDRTICIMADDDWQTDGNPGFTKAAAAAQVNGIRPLKPDFDNPNRGKKDTDYNDMARLRDAG